MENSRKIDGKKKNVTPFEFLLLTTVQVYEYICHHDVAYARAHKHHD